MTISDELVIRRLAERLADAATLAPGGTRWPRFELPSEHRSYAILGWLDEPVIAGASDPIEAKRLLAEKLIQYAKEPWEGPEGQPIDLMSSGLP